MADDGLSGIFSSYVLSKPASSCPSRSHLSKIYASDITLSKSSKDVDSTDQNDHASFESRDTLQSLVQSFFGCEDSVRSNPNGFRLPCKNMSTCNAQVMLNRDISSVSRKHSVISSNKCYNPPSHSPAENVRFHSPASASNVEESGIMTKKRRITWTEDLHKRFIECVDRLGGAKKATPKGILKLMNCDGLTIFHVKSHLQKYRVTDGISESIEGETRTSSKSVDPEIGTQIAEALRLQLDVQRHLYEQLESQRMLQLRLEEQAKELQEMFERQTETKTP